MGGGDRIHSKVNPEYRAYLQSKEWKAKREKRLEIDENTCCVCGREATVVHHLTYDRLRHEDLNDLVSLCAKCHQKAEDIYDWKKNPWAMEEKHPGGFNFMAAMRVDAKRIMPIVLDHLWDVRGTDLESLLELRQPLKESPNEYWGVLRRAVQALCGKRYSKSCDRGEDKLDLMMHTIINHAIVCSLVQIEHDIRNSTQAELHEIVMAAWAINGTQKKAWQALGMTEGLFGKFRGDNGESFGPSLRETVLHYCGLDAAAGIRPEEGFECLTAEDYKMLNDQADYIASVSGTGKFKGEYCPA